MTDLERCAREHGDTARAYERAGNAAAAAQLRRVENLLWALVRGEPWSTVLPKIGEPTTIDERTRVWWHGCWLRPGHFLFGRDGHDVHGDDAPPVARYGSYLDGGWAPRRRRDGSITFVCDAPEPERREVAYRTEECEQGQFLVHRLRDGAFTLMSWWDRAQGDRRGGCNSCYLVEGAPSVDDMLAWFPRHFPQQAQRLADAGIKLVQVYAN